jgi:hypothetical protein
MVRQSIASTPDDPQRQELRIQLPVCRLPAPQLRDGRLSAPEKGGGIGRVATVSPELVNQLPQRAVLESKSLSGFLLRAALDENGAQRFVTAMIGVRWSGKELAATGVVHDWCSWKCQLD